MKIEDDKSIKKSKLHIPIILALTVIILWAGSGFILFNMKNRGTFGDMFGSINALFSGLAFAGVIYAIILQKKELTLQREELALTRIELTRAAKAQEKSEKALTKQAESFSLSSQISAIDSLIDIYEKEIKSHEGVPYSGWKRTEVDERIQYLTKQKETLHTSLETIFTLLTASTS